MVEGLEAWKLSMFPRSAALEATVAPLRLLAGQLAQVAKRADLLGPPRGASCR